MRTDIVSGVRLISKGDMVVKAAIERGRFEPESLAMWRNLAGSGASMVDVGAYTGVYSICAALMGASVMAFEPSASAVRRLRENAGLNGVDVTLHQAAAWSEPATLTLTGKKGEWLSSSRTVAGKGSKVGRVKAVPVDSVVTGRVTALKIDAERAEIEILRGAMKTIAASLPVLLIEELDEEWEDAIRDMIGPLGYERRFLGQSMAAWSAR